MLERDLFFKKGNNQAMKLIWVCKGWIRDLLEK